MRVRSEVKSMSSTRSTRCPESNAICPHHPQNRPQPPATFRLCAFNSLYQETSWRVLVSRYSCLAPPRIGFSLPSPFSPSSMAFFTSANTFANSHELMCTYNQHHHISVLGCLLSRTLLFDLRSCSAVDV